MQLIYTWIKDFKSLNNLELNFGWRYRFRFDENIKLLSIEEDVDFIDHFFGGAISNVSALVGRNGSGKSSVIEYLINTLPTGQNAEPRGIIIHFNEENDQLIIYVHPSLIMDIRVDLGDLKYVVVHSLNNDYDYPSVIYFTNSFYDRVADNNIEGLLNSSLILELFKNRNGGKSISRTGEEFLMKFKFNEYAKTIAFLSRNFVTSLNIPLPKYLVLSAIFLSDFDLDQYFGNNKNQLEYKKIVDRVSESYDLKRQSIKSLREIFLLTLERNVVIDQILHFHLLEIIPEKISELLDNPSDVSTLFDKSDAKGKQWRIFLAFIGNLIDDFAVSANGTTAWVDIEAVGSRKLSELLVLIRGISNYNSNFLQLGLSHSKMEFSESSSGEMAMLSLMSRLYALSHSEQRYANLQLGGNVLILMDEAELYLHPSWQKRLIKYLVEVLPVIFDGLGMQVIMTSHSPFILSDLPKSRVSFFGGENGQNVDSSEFFSHKQTFASNIHTLLADTFFLENGFMGEYAKDKLDHVIKDLNTSRNLTPERKEIIRKIIISVGEPILKRKLSELYHQKFNLDLESRVSNIERKLGL